MFQPLAAVALLEQPVTPGNIAGCETALVEVAKLRSWLNSRVAYMSPQAALGNVRSSGAADTADFVRRSTKCSASEAKAVTKTAEQRSEIPSTSEAMDEGAISAENANALASLRASLDFAGRRAFADAEAGLVERAEQETPEEFRKTLRNWQAQFDAANAKERDRRQRDRTKLSLTKARDGMGIIHGEFDPENFELLSRAINEIASEMFHSDRKNKTGPDGETPNGLFRPSDNLGNNGKLMAEALLELCRRAKGGAVGSKRQPRPTVIVTIDEDSLMGRLNKHGITKPARMADGTPVPAETARRLACQANILPIVLDGQGRPLDVGRAKRLATGAQRTALRSLYDSCIVGWCDREFDMCEIHHIKPWESGGNTDLGNLVPVCPKHHHLIHDSNWHVIQQADTSWQFTPAGRPAPATTTGTGSSGSDAATAHTGHPANPNSTHNTADYDARPAAPNDAGQPRTPQRERPIERPKQVAGEPTDQSAQPHKPAPGNGPFDKIAPHQPPNSSPSLPRALRLAALA